MTTNPSPGSSPDLATPRPETPLAELDEPPCYYGYNCCHACETCRGCRYDEWVKARAALQEGDKP